MSKGKRRAGAWCPGRGCSVQYGLCWPLGSSLLLLHPLYLSRHQVSRFA